MKKIVSIGLLLGIIAPLVAQKEPGQQELTATQLLNELNMLGIQMVYQPTLFVPTGLDNANDLLKQAGEKVKKIQEVGTEEQLEEAKEKLAGMLNMYKLHLERKPRKIDSGPPLILLPGPRQARPSVKP